MSKITPKQAFDALRILDPRIDKIADKQGCLLSYNGVYMRQHYGDNIEWPEGVTQWPQPEPQWRVPTDEDAMKRPKCRVSDSEDKNWNTRTLLAVTKREKPFITMDEMGFNRAYLYCEIKGD